MDRGPLWLRGVGAALARQSASLFRSRQQRVEACIAAGPRAALVIDYRAEMGPDATAGFTPGQTLVLKGTSFFAMRDGRIVEVMDVQ